MASSLGAMTSCSDFLDVKPVGAVSEEELLNQEGVNYAITGMYSSMLTQEYFAAPLTNYAYGDVLVEARNKGSTFTDQSDFTNLETYAITTDNGYLNTKWKVVYEGVYRANNVINMIDKNQGRAFLRKRRIKGFLYRSDRPSPILPRILAF